MKSCEEIRQEYIKNIVEFSYKKEEESKVGPDGVVKDRTNSVYVTDICAWDVYCPKQIYYNKVSKRPALPEALIRFTIGHVVHEIPLWYNEDETKNGHEQAFTWNGIRCRMDEIDVENGIIVDKKTVASLPRSPKDYVVKQLNVYRVIAEDNPDRPVKITQLFVINLAVVNGQIQVLEVPMWDKEEAKAYIEKMVKVIKYHVENRITPDVEYKSKGWICDGCQYQDLCQTSSGAAPFVPKRTKKDGSVQSTLEESGGGGISVRVNKK